MSPPGQCSMSKSHVLVTMKSVMSWLLRNNITFSREGYRLWRITKGHAVCLRCTRESWGCPSPYNRISEATHMFGINTYRLHLRCSDFYSRYGNASPYQDRDNLQHPFQPTSRLPPPNQQHRTIFLALLPPKPLMKCSQATTRRCLSPTELLPCLTLLALAGVLLPVLRRRC